MVRLGKLKRRLQKNEKFPYLVTDLVNVRYLTGFNGTSACMLLDEKKIYFISDSRYEEYARSILPSNMEFILQENELTDSLKEVMKRIQKKELYIEDHNLVLSVYLQVKKKLRGIKLVPGGNEVNILRMVKDDDELNCLREAARITDRCVDHLKGIIRPGIREWDVAVEIEFFYRKNGCRKSSFESIVASGSGSSMPHYETSMKKKVRKGDPVLIDMGCEYMGYNSDLTRTLFVDSIDPLIEKVYSIVKKAQERAVRSVKPGITIGKLDKTARDIITNEGYGENFGHSLGHGLGLEVHELPAVKAGDLRLKKNMAITIEPGIYIPGIGGVRIEDMVVVTAGGCEILTKSTKNIVVI